MKGRRGYGHRRGRAGLGPGLRTTRHGDRHHERHTDEENSKERTRHEYENTWTLKSSSSSAEHGLFSTRSVHSCAHGVSCRTIETFKLITTHPMHAWVLRYGRTPTARRPHPPHVRMGPTRSPFGRGSSGCAATRGRVRSSARRRSLRTDGGCRGCPGISGTSRSCRC